jgi:hypothetical protein
VAPAKAAPKAVAPPKESADMSKAMASQEQIERLRELVKAMPVSETKTSIIREIKAGVSFTRAEAIIKEIG